MFFNANKSLTKIYIVKEEILQWLVFPHLFFFGLVCVEVNLRFKPNYWQQLYQSDLHLATVKYDQAL